MHNPKIGGRRRGALQEPAKVSPLPKKLVANAPINDEQERHLPFYQETRHETSQPVQKTEVNSPETQVEVKIVDNITIYPKGVCPTCKKHIGRGIGKHFEKCRPT